MPAAHQHFKKSQILVSEHRQFLLMPIAFICEETQLCAINTTYYKLKFREVSLLQVLYFLLKIAQDLMIFIDLGGYSLTSNMDVLKIIFILFKLLNLENILFQASTCLSLD